MRAKFWETLKCEVGKTLNQNNKSPLSLVFAVLGGKVR